MLGKRMRIAVALLLALCMITEASPFGTLGQGIFASAFAETGGQDMNWVLARSSEGVART